MFKQSTYVLIFFLILFSACSIKKPEKIEILPIILENTSEINNLNETITFEDDSNVSKNFKVIEEPKVIIEKQGINNITIKVVEEDQNISKENSETFLYLPKPGDSWQWQLSGKLNTKYDVDVYDIDLFETSKEDINDLHNRGIKVICYISAGSSENWREDFKLFDKSILGKDYDGWAGEKWLDISNYNVFEDVMIKRLDLASQKGCDGIEPDNIHGFQEETGFDLTYEDQLKYNIWLSEESHKRGLSIALKNDGEQAHDLIKYYDFAIVEECFEWDECEPYSIFIEDNKAVFETEYNLEKKEFCEKSLEMNFSSLKMDYDLAGERDFC